MTTNREFAADLRAATTVLSECVERNRQLNALAVAMLRSFATERDEIGTLESLLTSTRQVREVADSAVAQALSDYAGRFSEYRPSQAAMN